MCRVKSRFAHRHRTRVSGRSPVTPFPYYIPKSDSIYITWSVSRQKTCSNIVKITIPCHFCFLSKISSSVHQLVYFNSYLASSEFFRKWCDKSVTFFNILCGCVFGKRRCCSVADRFGFAAKFDYTTLEHKRNVDQSQLLVENQITCL